LSQAEADSGQVFGIAAPLPAAIGRHYLVEPVDVLARYDVPGVAAACSSSAARTSAFAAH